MMSSSVPLPAVLPDAFVGFEREDEKKILFFPSSASR